MKISSTQPSLNSIENSLRMQTDFFAGKPSAEKTTFADLLKESAKTVNDSLVQSDKMATDLATGKSSNIHETMLSATKAELGFNMMVQLRNKAIDAYQEVLRMQV
jgi:flagellar hook-basal body complex protein FliE